MSDSIAPPSPKAAVTKDAPTIAEEATANETTSIQPGDPISKVQTLLSSGARFTALKKHGEAVNAYAQACEQLVAIHGELASENGDAFLAYGRSLLNYAISQSGVLGMTAGGGNQKAPVRNDAGPSAGPSNKADPKAFTSSRIHFSGDGSDDEDDEADGQEEEGEAFSLENELENAFQSLDMARIVFEKSETPEMDPEEVKALKKKRAMAYDLIGDVHNEGEQFHLAVESYKASLALKETFVSSPIDRILAETHLFIALAYEFIPASMSLAIHHASTAREMMLANLAALKSLPSPTERDLAEIKDIEGVMGELNAKVDELKTVPEPAPQSEEDRALEAYLRNLPLLQAGAGGPSGMGEGVVNDLNLLVKKKKPSTAVAPSATAGDTTTNWAKTETDTNGHSVPMVVEGSGKRKAEDEPMEEESKKPSSSDNSY